jgi:hypothetical protein
MRWPSAPIRLALTAPGSGWHGAFRGRGWGEVALIPCIPIGKERVPDGSAKRTLLRRHRKDIRRDSQRVSSASYMGCGKPQCGEEDRACSRIRLCAIPHATLRETVSNSAPVCRGGVWDSAWGCMGFGARSRPRAVQNGDNDPDGGVSNSAWAKNPGIRGRRGRIELCVPAAGRRPTHGPLIPAAPRGILRKSGPGKRGLPG